MPNFFILKNLVDSTFPRKTKKRRRTKLESTSNDCDEDDLPLSKIVKTEAFQKDAKTCRICLKEGSFKIFDKESNKNKAFQIKEVSNVEISELDSFPKYMCNTCNVLLESAIVFRKTCQDSDRTLKDAAAHAEFDNMLEFVRGEVKLKECEKYSDDLPNDSDNFSAEGSDSKEFEKGIEPERCNVKVAVTPIAKSVLKVEVKTERIPSCYKCEKCNLSFTSNVEFVRHKRTPEHKSAMYKCHICSIEMTGSYLKTHIRRVHTIERPYICDVCGKGFAQEAAFRRHAAIHTDDLPYKCVQCPYRGRFRESVRIHMRTHTGERPFACAECPMTFATKSNLNRHSRQHKNGYPHECKECQRGFYTTTELQRHHKVVHSGIKDFPCNICGKEFGWRKEMKKHQRRVHHVAKCPRKGREPLYLKLEKRMQEEQDCYEQEMLPTNG